MQKRSKVALGTVLAAGIGYVAGVLTAPKSGSETRKDIRKKAAAAKTEAERKLKDAHSELDKVIDQANTQVTSSKEKVSSELKQALTKAEAAKQKAKELLSAVHEGEAEDDDLKKALKEAKEALNHVKAYLNKKADKPTPEQLGQMLKNIYESGYLDRNTAYKTSFIKGVLSGLGGVLGATVLVGLLLWGLTAFQDAPLIGRAVKNIRNTIQAQK